MTTDFEPPVFLLGTGRCGSTLFQKNVCRLANIWIWGEHDGMIGQLLLWAELIKTSATMQQFAYSSDLAELYSSLQVEQSSDATKVAWMNGFRPKDIDAAVRDLIDRVMRCGLPTGKSRWGFKEIRYGFRDVVPRQLLGLFPNSKIIHTVRHPCRTVESSIMSWHRPELREMLLHGNVEGIERLYAAAAERWCVMTSYLGDLEATLPERVLTVRLESAAEDFRKLAEFLNVRLEGANLWFDPVNTTTNYNDPATLLELEELRRHGTAWTIRLLDVGRRFGYNQ